MWGIYTCSLVICVTTLCLGNDGYIKILADKWAYENGSWYLRKWRSILHTGITGTLSNLSHKICLTWKFARRANRSHHQAITWFKLLFGCAVRAKQKSLPVLKRAVEFRGASPAKRSSHKIYRMYCFPRRAVSHPQEVKWISTIVPQRELVNILLLAFSPVFANDLSSLFLTFSWPKENWTKL